MKESQKLEISILLILSNFDVLFDERKFSSLQNNINLNNFE